MSKYVVASGVMQAPVGGARKEREDEKEKREKKNGEKERDVDREIGRKKRRSAHKYVTFSCGELAVHLLNSMERGGREERPWQHLRVANKPR